MAVQLTMRWSATNIKVTRTILSSGMLRYVALVRTDVSEELSASIWVTRIGEVGTTLAVTSNRRTLVTASVVPSSPIFVTLMKEALTCSETSVLIRATRRNIPENTILHSHRRENLKCYIKEIIFNTGIQIKTIITFSYNGASNSK
jgi:hypothetical protein